MEKFYFLDTDDIFCKSLESRLEDAQEEGLSTITLLEAIPDDITTDFVWCKYKGEVAEKIMCKKAECSFYSSKSGRGVCQHRGKLYLHGNEVTFEVPKSN